jgi:hypothetical protein
MPFTIKRTARKSSVESLTQTQFILFRGTNFRFFPVNTQCEAKFRVFPVSHRLNFDETAIITLSCIVAEYYLLTTNFNPIMPPLSSYIL